MEKIQSLMAELYDAIDHIRVEQIAPHIEEETLWAWCNGWRADIKDVLRDLEREVLIDRQIPRTGHSTKQP